MAYSTLLNLITRFGETEILQLTDRDNIEEIDDNVINAAINRASSRIDVACRGRYGLPLNPVDPLIIDIECDLARYYLYEDHATEAVEKRKDMALNDLKLIANGSLTLSATAAAAGASSTGMPEFETGDRIFTRRSMDGF